MVSSQFSYKFADSLNFTSSAKNKRTSAHSPFAYSLFITFSFLKIIINSLYVIIFANMKNIDLTCRMRRFASVAHLLHNYQFTK